MTKKLPADPDALYQLIEPMFGPLNAKRVDFAALRATLPPAAKTTKKLRATVIEDALVIPGSATIDSVSLEDGAALVVLGDLRIEGGLYSPPFAYSLVVVGGSLEVDRVHTSGDVIAFGGIHAKLWWASHNDHSAYAPTLDADVYVASHDRTDVVGALTAREKLRGFDLDAKLAARFTGLDPDSADSIRTFVGIAKPKPRKAGAMKEGALDAIRAELDAAWAMTERIPKVKAIRTVYATIKKKRLAACGELLVAMIARKKEGRRDDWSIQDELELLATLRRADLLEALPKEHIEGYEGWMPGLLATARE